MNAKTPRASGERDAQPWLRAALSALCLFAASPALAGAPAAGDSTGDPVRATEGRCVDSGSRRSDGSSKACAQSSKRITYRILQNLIPQPYVTYDAPPPTPPAPPVQELRFLPRTAFVAGRASITPELRDELQGFLASLEGYQRIERFEVIGHGDGAGSQWLSDRRAEAVRFFLAERGIASPMLAARGAAEADDAARGRIEILVTARGRR